MAKKPPKPAAGYVPSGKPAVKPSGAAPVGHAAPQAYVGGGDVESIKEMQSAILELSSIMSKNYMTSMHSKSEEKGGSDPFGNFLVKNYINNKDVVGEQFINVDEVEPTRSNTAMKNKSLRGVISTMGRVGTPGAERAVDGIWKTRTNNALKQAAAVAAGMLKLSSDMHLKLEGYTEEDLKTLKDNIPASYTQLGNTAGKRAQVIAQNLKKLIAFYKGFETNVINNEKHKAFITQQKPFTEYNKQVSLTDEENSFFSQNSSQSIPNVNVEGRPVTLADIRSPDAFKAFLKSINVTGDDPAIYNRYLSQVESAIGASRYRGE